MSNKPNRNRTEASERRQHERVTITRPCKVFREATQRYLIAQSCDVSEGGVLVHLLSERPLTEGESVRLAIAGTSSGVMRDAELRDGIVVRCVSDLYNLQTVAIRYGQEEAQQPQLAQAA